MPEFWSLCFEIIPIQVWVQVQTPAVIWQSLPKPIPGGNQIFWQSIQWQNSWAALWHRFGWSDRQAQTQGVSNFQVGSSSCWQQPASFKEECCRLGNYLWHDSDSIASKVCIQTCHNEKWCLKAMTVNRPAVVLHWQDKPQLWYKDILIMILSNLLLKNILTNHQ